MRIFIVSLTHIIEMLENGTENTPLEHRYRVMLMDESDVSDWAAEEKEEEEEDEDTPPVVWDLNFKGFVCS